MSPRDAAYRAMCALAVDIADLAPEQRVARADARTSMCDLRIALSYAIVGDLAPIDRNGYVTVADR